MSLVREVFGFNRVPKSKIRAEMKVSQYTCF